MRYQPSQDETNDAALRSQMRADAEERAGLKGEELRAWRAKEIIRIDREMRELSKRNYF